MLDTPLSEPLGIMTLMAMRNVGVATAEKALARFSTLREMHEASPESCKGTLNANVAAAFRDLPTLGVAWDKARSEVDEALKAGVALLTPYDDAYPERLRGTPERPLVLYALGDLSCTDRSVACVGTRDPTKFGDVVCTRLTGMLADGGWSIVSGLARGIDHAAHETALLHDARTVAVIGSGLDAMGSERQRELAQRILDAGGALVTEQPFGREVDAGSLIRRNRIQSGLSAATFVMQSKPDGGTMQTARYALTQGRPVYAPLPTGRNAEDEASGGLLLLLRGTGPELARTLGAKGSFVALMEERWADRPVASAISGRDDYERVLSELEELVARNEPAAPAFA